MESPFKDIVTGDLGQMPAMVDISTGVLTINPPVLSSLPRFWQRFIMLHEQGHLETHSTEETVATKWAEEHFIQGSSPGEIAGELDQLAQIRRVTLSQGDEQAQSERVKWQKTNPNLAGFWTAVIGIFKAAVGGMKKNQQEKENKDQKTIEESNQLLLDSQAEIERQRKLRVYLTWLPFITLAIVLIALIIVKK